MSNFYLVRIQISTDRIDRERTAQRVNVNFLFFLILAATPASGQAETVLATDHFEGRFLGKKTYWYVGRESLDEVSAEGFAMRFTKGEQNYLNFGLHSDPIWMHVKLLLVVAMSVLHMRLAWHVKRFAAGENRYSAVYFRILNEVPTVLMIAIVILAVVKPF